MAVCSTLSTFLENNIFFLIGLISLLSTSIIVIMYLLGSALSNAKLLVWSKTEIIQLIISVISVLLIIVIINGFCSISPDSIYALTSLSPNQQPHHINGSDLFEGATTFMIKSTNYTHTVLKIERFHLMAYDYLSMRSVWDCGGILDCWGSSVGLSGKSYAWAPYLSSGFNLAFNSALLSYISSLNFLFILQYINTGFVLLFLPLGMILRVTPFMRRLGSLFIAIAFSFMIVYPLLLTSFNLLSGTIFNYVDNSILSYADESKLMGFDFGDAYMSSHNTDSPGSDSYLGKYIFKNGRKEGIAFQLVGRSLLVGIFFPTLALLASIASVGLVSKELGEEINLSRIVQMV